MQWSPTRREFLGVAGAGGIPTAGVGNVSWGNVTDVVPNHPFAPTADVQWSVDLGDGHAFLFDPVDDTFYVRMRGTVHAISVDGNVRWQFEVDRKHPSVVVGPKSAYLAGNRTVYVGDDEHVYALDAEEGGIRWRYEGGRYSSVRLAIRDIVLVRDDGLVALSASDGSERWQFEPEGRMWLRPQYDGERLYVGTDYGRCYALDPEDGTVHWRAELPETDGNDYTTEYPTLRVTATTDELVFAWDADEATLHAFETTDGTERWQFESNSDRSLFRGTVLEEVAYVNEENTVRAISTADGSERWRYDAEAELGWRPRSVGDTIYVGAQSGIHALSVADGRKRWQSGAGTIVSEAIDDTLVVHDPESSVYGLSTGDGRVRWQYDPEGPLGWLPQVHEKTVYFSTKSGTVTAISNPESTPVSDALRTVTSPAGLAVGGLLGGALAVRTYRRRAREESATDSPESVTFEDFELVELIAETDWTTVHEARTPDGERGALKRLEADAIPAERFADAVETWDGLDHSGVLEVRAWGSDPTPWVVTEIADANLANRADGLTTAELVPVIAEVAETVHWAHGEGVTHDGLEPESIWFVGGDVRVGDWRLAAEIRGSSEDYEPPETDPAPEDSDTTQLAAMADDLLGDDRGTGELDAVLSRALADDPADRYDSALKFADALRWAVRE